MPNSPIDVSADARALLDRAADLAADFLDRAEDRNQPVTRCPTPEHIRRRLALALPKDGRPVETLFDDLKIILEESVLTAHPGFCNQLFGTPDPVAIIAEWVVAVLNTSMYTYEVAPVLTLMEIELIAKLAEFANFELPEPAPRVNMGLPPPTEDDELTPRPFTEGTFTAGGSISNLMAVMMARHHARPAIKDQGLLGGPQMVIFTSVEAHYSLQRAAIMLGLGADACRGIPTDANGRMDPAALEATIEDAKAKGEHPFMVSATVGTTVLGVFDPLEPIAEISRRHNLWLHADGAYGGSALLSNKHRGKLRGLQYADSLSWCPHKMMNIPLICSVILTRRRGMLSACNAVSAEYLFHQSDEDSCLDQGDISIQCGRRADALKLWLAWQARGSVGLAKVVDAKFEQAADLRKLIRARENFVLLHDPDPLGGSPNTCFHYIPPSLRETPDSPAKTQQLQDVTHTLRSRLKRQGKYLINYAPVLGVSAFRHVASHPGVTTEDLSSMLDEIENLGATL